MQGVRAINYEERYIFMLLRAVINQTEIQTLRKRVDWERLLKISDFHNILSTVYYGILGIEKDASEECIDEFYQKYKKQLLLFQTYVNAEETIRWQLERYQIHALWLTGSDMYDNYYKQEMGHISAIEVAVRKKDLPRIHRLMLEMDYEQKENRMGKGIIYTRIAGIRVIFYAGVPFENKVLKKYFSQPIANRLCLDGYQYIHVLGRQEEYVYRYGRLVEAYIVGELKIRLVMNVWQYEQRLGENFPREMLQDLWKKAQLSEFVKQVKLLSQLWFGEVGNEECGTALELEEYILTRKHNKWLDEALIPHERMRLDFYRRDREREWLRKKKQWWFPSREYMTELFPTLERYPFLLSYFRLVRMFRFFRFMCSRCMRQQLLKAATKYLSIKEKWKERFGKKEEEAETESEVVLQNAAEENGLGEEVQSMDNPLKEDEDKREEEQENVSDSDLEAEQVLEKGEPYEELENREEDGS